MRWLNDRGVGGEMTGMRWLNDGDVVAKWQRFGG